MNNWVFNPADYSAKNYPLIPEGDHRVRVNKVVAKVFSNGLQGFQIELDVSGYNSKLRHFLTLDPSDPKRTNQRIGMFFDSFGIADYNLEHYTSWLELNGAVRVRHDFYEGKKVAKVAFCLGRSQQDRLPPWRDNTSSNKASIHNEEENAIKTIP